VRPGEEKTKVDTNQLCDNVWRVVIQYELALRTGRLSRNLP